MKKLISKAADKINLALLKTKLAANKFLTEERGDTNFISIAIVLVIVLAIATIFVTFGKDWPDKLQKEVDELLNAFS